MTKTITFNVFDLIKNDFKFNQDRIYEMHQLLSRVACLKDCPGIENDLVRYAIKDIDDYLKKWQEVRGVPCATGTIEVPFDDVKE
jgi:hypothetical protein